VYLIGDGSNRINPIHGADLATVCADAVELGVEEIDVGGPEILTHREIARLAFAVAGKPPRITSIPVWLMRVVGSLTRVFSQHQGELLAFFIEAMTNEAVAPITGSRTLVEHFRAQVPSPETHRA
jgi:uncharacterized protein YbjT (DUF2867 family)